MWECPNFCTLASNLAREFVSLERVCQVVKRGHWISNIVRCINAYSKTIE
ncbi:hypothetical protein M7I_3888 [Glarea lozoyensis 74030]|uniref:Uncharacterized protein n=1 Tax=Glarea lozoyensis (strain ATCC 74030 / MF5533) TaxID=1104152 RepID=H0EMP9_GLAL7|nr:hypothetical protein M7I_3888 [Glarea lozoyensis 74030]